MPITSLEFSDELAQRVVSAARELGVTPQAFMLDAIREATDGFEQRTHFVAQARAAHIEMLESGLGHDAADVRAYLRARIANKSEGSEAPPLPANKPWRE